MRRYALETTVGVLAVLWLSAIAITLCYIAGLVGSLWLIGAVVALIGVFAVTGALLLTTNTRRPAGIDPNTPGKPTLARRATDGLDVVARLTRKLEEMDADRPAPDETPQWAVDLMKSESAKDSDVEAL